MAQRDGAFAAFGAAPTPGIGRESSPGREDTPMFSLTVVEGGLLGAALVAVTVALVVGVLVAFPRRRRLVSAAVHCPLLDRTVTAELAQDDWTLRYVDVTRCTALGGAAAVLCDRRCLALGVRALPAAA
jgi:hypothetical protein